MKPADFLHIFPQKFLEEICNKFMDLNTFLMNLQVEICWTSILSGG